MSHPSARRHRRAVATAGTGLLLTAGLLAPAASAEVADLPEGVPSNELLLPHALDDRVADDGVTPIAVRATDAAGEEIVYGARPSTTPPVADLDAAVTGTRYFVDCSAPEDGTGEQDSPFADLEAINAVELDPGDQVLFRRGATCTGMFQPQGSGTAEDPVVVDAYDAEADAMARIDAAGEPQAVYLYNVEHYEVRNLELTNFTDDEGDFASGSVRRGLTVAIEDIGVGQGYTITDLYIHTVRGENKKDNGGSGGIQLEVHGSQTPTKYRDVEIAHNTVRDTNRSGINMSTTWWGRPEVQSTDGNYYAWDPMYIHDNFVTDVGGDGIVLQYASGSRVEHNTVEDVANTKDGQSMNGANAAVWPWNADDVSFRYNHVFGTVRGEDNNDGQAFDADFGGTGNLYEHNLSHDNEGGFMLFCGCWGLTTDTVVRYNVSLNDGRPVPLADGSTGIARTFFMAGQADGQVYNNSFLLPSVPVDIAHPDNYLADSAVLANNVFLAQEETEVQETATAVDGATIVWRNNVFGGSDEGWPEVNAEQDNLVLPELTLADGVGLERLQLTAAQGVGAPIAPEGVLDFVGNPVPSVTSPDAGAFQLTPVGPQTTVADGGFELDPAEDHWQLEGPAQRVGEGQRTGHAALAVDEGGSATTTVPVAVNRTYRLVAAVSGDDGESLPTVSLTLPSGAVATAEPLPEAEPDEDGYVPVAVTARTSTDATTLDITVEGQGLVDDVALLTVDDLMVDGSFEATRNTVWQENNADTWSEFARSTDATSGSLASPVTPEVPAVNRFTYVEPGEEYELGVFAKAADGETVTLEWSNAEDDGAEVSTSSTQWERVVAPLSSSTAQLTVACRGSGVCDDMTLTAAWDGVVPPIEPVDGEDPTEEPTDEPTDEPTEEPTEDPSPEPTDEPTEDPSPEPTGTPTQDPDEPTPTADASTPPSGAEPGDDQGSLPSTGAQIGTALVAAVVLLTAGAALVLRRRQSS